MMDAISDGWQYGRHPEHPVREVEERLGDPLDDVRSDLGVTLSPLAEALTAA